MAPAEVLSWVRTLLDLVLSMVPHNVASQLLDDAAVARQRAIADTAMDAKFGPKR